MNQTELAGRLRQALEESGRTTWELSRRSNVKLQLVEALLAGVGDAPVRALVRVADSLELDIELMAAGEAHRDVGPVPTVVDVALEQLRPRDRTKGPPTPAGLLAGECAALERLIAFARSCRYELLLDRVQHLTGKPAPDWMPAWLVRPVPGLAGTPVDLVEDDDGIERVANLFARLVAEAGT